MIFMAKREIQTPIYNNQKNPLISLRASQQYLIQNINILTKMFEAMEPNEIEEAFQLLIDFKNKLKDDEKEQLYNILISKTSYTSIEEIENEIKNYKYYCSIFSQYNQYAKRITIQEVYQNLQDESQSLDHTVPYLLSHYIKHYKCKKGTYFTNTKQGYDIKEIVLGYFQFNQGLLLEKAKELVDIKEKIVLEAKEKKINKTIQKATTILNKIKNQTEITDNEVEYNIQRHKKETLDRISQHVTPENYHLFPIIQDFLQQCQYIPRPTIKKDLELIQEEEKIDYSKITMIGDLLNSHEIYFKKSQIQSEIDQEPELIQLFLFYSKTLDETSQEIRLQNLQELLSDIKETGKKNWECCRRLTSMINKDIELIYSLEEENEDIEEEYIEKNNKNDIQLGPQIQIGKTFVYKETGKKHPINIDKLSHLLNIDSRGHMRHLERLIFEIGYDKVHAYLTKAPDIYIEDLDAIIRTDRQLRFEFQRILEDIEMYFRSSLTYYLTNKYDMLYQSINDSPFYVRGYLTKHIFMDGDEHYTHIGQLNERIDQEISNNNQQVISEFEKFKYALPFSTSAGIMTFGWLISFFDNLNYNDRLEYLSTYYHHITPQTFSSWMNNLAALRNRCAHYHSLYRLSSLKELRPIMTKDIDGNAFDDDFKHSSLFYYTIVMTRLSPDVYNIEDFIDNLGVIFRKASRDNYSFDLAADYTFPKNWRQILENEKNTKIKMNIE